MQACIYCSENGSTVYHSGSCPKVKMIEYYPSGRVKRVEFHDPTPEPLPYIPSIPYAPAPYWWNPPYTITCGSSSGSIVVNDGGNPTATTRITGIYNGQID